MYQQVNESILPPSFLPACIKNFVGREKILKRMNEAIFEKNIQIIILSAFAGVGKSSVANKFGYTFKEKNSNNYAFWMKSDENNLENEFRYFSSKLEIHTDFQRDKEILIREVNNKLHKLEEKILFIFDNCDNHENLASYLNNLPENIFVLITTRDSTLAEQLNINSDSEHIVLEPFEENESFDFIRNSFGKRLKNENDIIELVDLIDISKQKIRPYILNKMVAFVKLKIGPITSMKSFIEKAKLNQDVAKIIFGDDELFFSELITGDNETWEILKYSSFLDPDFIPIRIYTEMLEFNEEKMNVSVEKLQKLSLIKVEETENDTGLRIHRTLQAEIQKYLKTQNENEINTIITKFIHLLNAILSDTHDELSFKSLKNQVYFYNVVNMIEKIFKSSIISDEIKTILRFKLGNYNFALGKYLDAKQYYETVLDYYKRTNDENKLRTANVLDNLGETYNRLGRYQNSLAILEESLAFKNEISNLNALNLDIAKTLEMISSVLIHLGNYNEALLNYEKCLSIHKNFSEKNESIANILHQIGIIHLHLGTYELAIHYLDQSLTLKKDIFKTNENLSIARTINSIGLVFVLCGRYKRALEYLLISLKIILTNVSDDHFFIAITYNNIGMAYNMLKDYKKAIDYSEKSLLIYSKIFSNRESQIQADCFLNIGVAHVKLGNNEKSLEYLKKALEIYRKTYRTEKNFRIAECLNSIGLVEFNLKKYDAAKECYGKALDMYNEVFESLDNLRIAFLFDNISLNYEKLGDLSEALKFAEKSLRIKNEKKKDDFDFDIQETIDRITFIKIQIQ
jgi:tetratricopeptide (TPR) repeat protein